MLYFAAFISSLTFHRRQESNPRPLGCKSSYLTTRRWLLAKTIGFTSLNYENLLTLSRTVQRVRYCQIRINCITTFQLFKFSRFFLTYSLTKSFAKRCLKIIFLIFLGCKSSSRFISLVVQQFWQINWTSSIENRQNERKCFATQLHVNSFFSFNFKQKCVNSNNGYNLSDSKANRNWIDFQSQIC